MVSRSVSVASLTPGKGMLSHVTPRALSANLSRLSAVLDADDGSIEADPTSERRFGLDVRVGWLTTVCELGCVDFGGLDFFDQENLKGNRMMVGDKR
jgi:hypothetical protein